MDLSQLSDDDLLALKGGDLSRVSDAGLMALKGGTAAPMSAASRFGMGMADPIQGGAQLLTKVLPEGVVKAGNAANNWLADKTGMVARLPEGGVDQQTREREAAYKASRGPDAGFDWARLGGNVASPVNLALGAGAGMAGAASLPMRMGVGGAVGASAGALAPVTQGDDFAAEKAKQAAMGGVFGAATPAAIAGVSRVISPKASVDPALALLKSEGVRPTVGQSLGGWANRAEEKMMSLPIMGDAIGASRRRAVEDFNRAAINRATAPIGVKVTKIGQEGIKEAGDALSQGYDDVLAGLKSIKFDGQWRQEMGQLKTMAKALPSNVRGTFQSKVKTLIDDRVSQAGGMTAQTMKQLDSELGEVARRYGRSAVASEQELGDAFLQAQALLREQVGRNSPQAAAAIKKLNEGWANLVRVERAGAAGVNADGVFTPAQLNNAIKAADSSVRKRAVSRGTALMQDLGNAGGNLSNRVPNSGTFDRMAMAAAGLGAYWINPAIPAGLIAGAGAYTPPAQALLRGLATARPQAAQPIAGLLNRASPMLAPAGGLLGMEMFD